MNTIEIWLILPVVICLFQGLSHACLRITAMQESAHGSLHQTQSAAKMLRKRIIGYLVRNAKLIHELMGSFRSTRRRLAESVVTDPADEWKYKPMHLTMQYNGVVLNQFIFAKAGLASVFWRTTALSASDGRVVDCHGVDGSGGLGFDSGEGAWETATTSTEGSRRVNCPMTKNVEAAKRNRCLWCLYGIRDFQWGIFNAIQHRVTIGGQVWCQHPR